MDKNKIIYIVNIGLLAVFFSLFTTGLIKFPGLLQYFGITRGMLPFSTISTIHEWSGITLSILVFIHLILNLKWIVVMTKKYLRV